MHRAGTDVGQAAARAGGEFASLLRQHRNPVIHHMAQTPVVVGDPVVRRDERNPHGDHGPGLVLHNHLRAATLAGELDEDGRAAAHLHPGHVFTGVEPVQRSSLETYNARPIRPDTKGVLTTISASSPAAHLALSPRTQTFALFPSSPAREMSSLGGPSPIAALSSASREILAWLEGTFHPILSAVPKRESSCESIANAEDSDDRAHAGSA